MEPLLRKQIQTRAERIAHEAGFRSLPICPKEIARQHQIAVIAKDESDFGCSGQLIRAGNNFGILYATHVKSIGFQNFSIAHELGHYFLDGHSDAVLKNGSHSSEAGTSRDKYEQEADIFAASLLMPEALFRNEIHISGEGFEAIESIAIKSNTSLTATAIRYAELTEQPIAIIFALDGKITSHSYSGAFREICNAANLQNLNGTPVPRKTLTHSFHKDKDKITSCLRENEGIDLSRWFGCDMRYTGVESVAGLGAYGRTLTILSISPSLHEDLYTEDDCLII